MSFQVSSLRVAGQDSDIMDIFFSSSDAPQSLLNAGWSHMPAKQMYGNSETIQSWIDAIDGTNKSVFKFEGADVANVFECAIHPSRTHYPRSPLSDEFESKSDISFPLDASAWLPEVFASSYYSDSDESPSESSLSDDAQYITIPSDSPWYRPPSPSPGPFSAYELSTTAYVNSCSNNVRQAIAQQELLLAIFHEELRRVLPRDNGSEYDSDWLEDMDTDLLLAPLETYADLCWESAVREMSVARRLDRPVPDVPVGFDKIHDTY